MPDEPAAPQTPKEPRTKFEDPRPPTPEEKRTHLKQSLLLCGILVVGAICLVTWQTISGGLDRAQTMLDKTAEALKGAFATQTKTSIIVKTSIGDLHKAGALVVLQTDIPVEVEAKDTHTVWGLSLGTTTARVRVPTKIQYVLPLDDITADSITYDEARERVVIRVPQPALDEKMIDIDLTELEVESSIGWARTDARSGVRLREKAIEQVRPAALAQAGNLLLREKAESEGRAQLHALLAPLAKQLRKGVEIEIQYDEPSPPK